MNSKKSIENQKNTELFLPNFCDVHTVFFAIILTELLAFVFILIPLNRTNYDWNYVRHDLVTDLAMISFFMQWITLLSAGILCSIRRWLSQLENNIIMGLIVYLLILIITLIISECAWWINETLSFNERVSLAHQQLLLRNIIISILAWTLIGGIIYRLNLWKKSTLIFSFAIIFIVTLLLSELADFLFTHSQFREHAARHHLFLLRNFLISMIISGIVLRYFYIQYYWKKLTESNASARFQALQSRIRPHFLFNSMNTIASLIRLNQDKAEHAIEDLADLFRASLKDVNHRVTLEEELSLCYQYINIEKLRLEERLQVVWQIENLPNDALIPALTIQPLLENAVYYGIQPLLEGGTIHITGLFDGKQIHIDIENPVVGEQCPSQGNQIAQKNIVERLQLYYGLQAKFTISMGDHIYCVSLHFPYEK